jgi:hypothetical protein
MSEIQQYDLRSLAIANTQDRLARESKERLPRKRALRKAKIAAKHHAPGSPNGISGGRKKCGLPGVRT